MHFYKYHILPSERVPHCQGNWDALASDLQGDEFVAAFTGGVHCYNGPARSAKVVQLDHVVCELGLHRDAAVARGGGDRAG